MIVVADAGPLHYLILIGAVDVLGPLYNRVVLPEAVAQELRYQRAVSWGPPREGAILSPSVYVIAGPNGVGKTTFAREFLPAYADCRNFINADLIALGVSPFRPEAAAFRAGRLMLEEHDVPETVVRRRARRSIARRISQQASFKSRIPCPLSP